MAVRGDHLLCRHLLDTHAVDAGIDHVKLLRGRGVEYDACCTACDPQANGGVAPELVEACEGCVTRAIESDTCTAWRGEPTVLERPEPLSVTSRTTPLPDVDAGVADWRPVPGAVGSQWLLLTGAGRVVRWDADSGAARDLAVHSVRETPARPRARRAPRRRLHASADGRFAAVVDDYGRFGQVLDLTTGAVTLDLDGGDYHEDLVPFSLAFLRYEGRTLVVHRTAWNRLDVSDAATGELLTGREFPTRSADGPSPPHYSGYFRGGLSVSPDGRSIADDGWVWSPFGIPVAWRLEPWLTENVWESEDGPTRRRLGQRAYCWNLPMCWVGDHLLALSGIGDDDEVMLTGVVVVDVLTGAEVLAFAGPSGELFVHDGRLFSVADGTTQVWDPATGERTATFPGVAPSRYHPGTGEFAALTDAGLIRWELRSGATTALP